jgi:dTMP kinase
LAADLSILIDLSVEAAAERLAAGAPDRLERLGPEFASRVRDGFLTQAEADPDHWVVVDGTLEPVSLAARIVEVVRARLGEA